MIPGKPQSCVGCPSCQPQRCEVVQTDRDGRTIWLLHEQGCGCCRATICLFRDCQAHMPCRVLLLTGSRCQAGSLYGLWWDRLGASFVRTARVGAERQDLAKKTSNKKTKLFLFR